MSFFINSEAFCFMIGPIISNVISLLAVFNDGSRKELLCLEGTIPVSYKGKTTPINTKLNIILFLHVDDTVIL